MTGRAGGGQVSLAVLAIGDGAIARATPPKLLRHRFTAKTELAIGRASLQASRGCEGVGSQLAAAPTAEAHAR